VESTWLSLVPPVLAISVSLATRKVIPALGAATVVGALLVSEFSLFEAVLRLGAYGSGAISGSSHLGILGFSLLLGALMGLTKESGEQEKLARLATRYATTRARGQVATWILGLVIFFDDYLNTLVVGSTMRPIYDRLRISREKLAFLVDATSAPVASLAVVSSWIAVEIGYINEQYRALGIHGDGFVVFIESLPYRFYPWLTLVFALAVAALGRDFGPMLTAERRAAALPEEGDDAKPGEQTQAEPAPQPQRGMSELLTVLPLLCLVLCALLGMLLDGYLIALTEDVTPTLRNIFARSRSHVVLVSSALLGNVVALGIALGVRRSRAKSLGLDMLRGMQRMLLPCGILVLAWSLSSVCRDLGTAHYLIARLGREISPELLPAAVFLVGAATSFATGTSWGTMAILFPIVLPLAFGVSGGDEAIMLGTISSILAGAVWGDHCSPVSDTTIMSSLASGCDHMSHVKTQLPYAGVVGVVSLVLGDMATGFGFLSPWASLLLGSSVLVLIVRFFGRPSHFPSSVP
jgi:Na+/H+ antiporter NhaC